MSAQNRRFVGGVAVMALVAVLGWAPTASATIWNLSDGNSLVNINDSSQAGVFDWIVDGQDQLYQQWFWYRVGNTAEASIDTLPLVLATPFFGTRALELQYAGNGLSVEVTYILTGGSAGSTRSDMAEIIRITNTGADTLALHFFQYSDFDLCGPGGDSVNIVSPNQVSQSDGNCSLSETVLTPGANRWEANGWPSTLVSLNDGAPTTLNGNSLFGPGDATWAYQWDVNLSPDGTFLISKNKSIQPVPEPMTVTLLGAGLAGLALRRRRG